MTQGTDTAAAGPPTAALFTEVKRMRSSDDVVDQIRGAILAGQLKTGDRLPNERDLCGVFGVSRATLREGLRTLEALGAIEIRPGATGGIFATEPQGDQVGAALESLLRFRHVTAQELSEFRTSFEGETAHWAATRATDDDVKHLRELVDQFVGLAQDNDVPWPTLAEVDIAFHEAMAYATKNQVRVAIMLGIHRALHQASTSLADHMTPASRRAIGNELRSIVDAIDLHDASLARTRMRRHVKKFSELELKVLGDDE
jgi:DNA-binding FadR family transcriptional regulator